MTAVGSLTLASIAWSIHVLTISRGSAGRSLRLRLSEVYSRRIFSKCRSLDIIVMNDWGALGFVLSSLELTDLSFEGGDTLVLCVDRLLVGVQLFGLDTARCLLLDAEKEVTEYVHIVVERIVRRAIRAEGMASPS